MLTWPHTSHLTRVVTLPKRESFFLMLQQKSQGRLSLAQLESCVPPSPNHRGQGTWDTLIGQAQIMCLAQELGARCSLTWTGNTERGEMLVPSEAQLPKDRRMDAGQVNKTDVYRNPNPASTSRGKWKEGFSPAPSSLCFQPKMPPSCIIMPPPSSFVFPQFSVQHNPISGTQNFYSIDLSLHAAICVWCLFKSRRKRFMLPCKQPKVKRIQLQKIRNAPVLRALGLWVYLMYFFPALLPQPICLPQKQKTSALWHFASNICSVLEFAKALPSHLSLVPQETPALPPGSWWDCYILLRPGALKVKWQMAMVSQLRALLLAVGVGWECGLGQLSFNSAPLGPNLGLAKWQPHFKAKYILFELQGVF